MHHAEIFKEIFCHFKGKILMEKLSFVIPCYCSEDTIDYVVNQIENSMKNMLGTYKYEILLVNDGSPDETGKVLEQLAREREHIVAIQLARNFGQHAAIMAGFHLCTGDIVICLDDDGQTPPTEVGKLLEKLDEGYDVVFARYLHKQHSIFRNVGSKVNAIMAESLLGKDRKLFISSYYAMRRFVVDEAIKYRNPYPYLLGIILRITTRIANVDVEHHERLLGVSGYGVHKLLALWLSGFTSFSVKPLRVASLVGVACSLIGFCYGVFIVVRKLMVPEVAIGWSSMMASLWFVGGVIMMMLGMMGEYVGRIYICQNNLPQFVVREIVRSNRRE